MTEIDRLLLDGVVPVPDDVADSYRREGYWQDQTLSEMVYASADREPEKLAVIDGDVRLTYAELDERIRRFAAGFDAAGIGRGDRVVVQLPNSADYLAVLFGLSAIGAVPVLALLALRDHEIRYFVEFTGARAYVTVDRDAGHDLGALASSLVESTPWPLQPFIFSASGDSADVTALLSAGILSRQRRCSPADVAFLQLSGGTTGTPKVIPHTHEDYLCSARTASAMCGIASSTVQLVVLPMCHSLAMRSPGYLGVLMAGGTVVAARSGSPDLVFPLIARLRVTDVSVVPPLALAWMNSSLVREHDLSSLNVLRVGGARFSEEAARRVRPELGATVQQTFGMAEGLTVFTSLGDPDDEIVRTQGRPTTEVEEVLVVDDDGRVLPTGSEGHLLNRGPSTIRGYYRSSDETAAIFTADGFYRTGDIVRVDETGNITVVGRSKDQINRGGEKISPEEIENLLLGHGGIHDTTIVGVPDPGLGEKSKAFIVPRDPADGESLTLSEIRRFLRGRGLAAFKLPDEVEVVDRLERTAVGKISKRFQRQR